MDFHVADRESDFYELTAGVVLATRHGLHHLLRSAIRRLAADAGSLLETLAQTLVLGQRTMEAWTHLANLPKTASVELRSVRVQLDVPCGLVTGSAAGGIKRR